MFLRPFGLAPEVAYANLPFLARRFVSAFRIAQESYTRYAKHWECSSEKSP